MLGMTNTRRYLQWSLGFVLGGLSVMSCTESDMTRREREALAYGAALSEVARFEPPGDTIIVRAVLQTWPDSVALQAMRERFLRPGLPSALVARTARAVTRPGHLEVTPHVAGRVVLVVDSAAARRGTNFQLSPVAFTAHKDSAVVYVERFIDGETLQSYMLVLVGHQAGGQWKRLEDLGWAVSARSHWPEALAVLPN
jgi:hypothetical protein